MSDNVTSIFGGPVSDGDAFEPNEDVIENLEEVLEAARRGEVQSIAMVWSLDLPNGSTEYHRTCVPATVHYAMQLLSSMGLLERRIQDMLLTMEEGE